MDWQNIFMDMNITPTILMYSLAKMTERFGRTISLQNQYGVVVFLTHYDGNIYKGFLESMGRYNSRKILLGEGDEFTIFDLHNY